MSKHKPLTSKEDFINEMIQLAKETTPGFDVSLISDGTFTFDEYRYFILSINNFEIFTKAIEERRKKELEIPNCVFKTEEE